MLNVKFLKLRMSQMRRYSPVQVACDIQRDHFSNISSDILCNSDMHSGFADCRMKSKTYSQVIGNHKFLTVKLVVKKFLKLTFLVVLVKYYKDVQNRGIFYGGYQKMDIA